MPTVLPSLILSLIPISFIIGSFAVNLNIIFLFSFGLFYLFKNKLKINFNKIDILILLYFFFIIFNGLYNHLEYKIFDKNYLNDDTVLIKSAFYIRYAFLYFSLRVLIENKLINLNYLIITSTITVFFVSLDIIYQYINGKDIFGYISPYTDKISGPFGDEAVAGSFLQKFSFIYIFSVIFFFKNDNYKLKILILFLTLSLITFSLLLSGNRMPFVLFVFGLFLIFINIKLLRNYFLFLIFFILVSTAISYSFNPQINQYLNRLYSASENILSIYYYRAIGDRNEILEANRTSYINEFDAGIDTWKMNKIIGGGVKSFRFNCPNRVIEYVEERTICNMHPHNYYLEILSELGVFGLFLILIIIFEVIKNFKRIKKMTLQRYYTFPFFYIFLLEFFPIRTTGSFFTTSNATIIFVSIAFIVSMANLDTINSKSKSN